MAGFAARNIVSSFPAPVRAAGFPLLRLLFPSTYRSVENEVARCVGDPELRAVLRLSCQTLPTEDLVIAQ